MTTVVLLTHDHTTGHTHVYGLPLLAVINHTDIDTDLGAALRKTLDLCREDADSATLLNPQTPNVPPQHNEPGEHHNNASDLGNR